MEALISKLKEHAKIDRVRVDLAESMSDVEVIEQIYAVVNSHRKLTDWWKAIYIKPCTKVGYYTVKVYCTNNPLETPIQEIYANNKKVVEWVAPSYGHDKPNFSIEVTEEDLFKLVNWKHSISN